MADTIHAVIPGKAYAAVLDISNAPWPAPTIKARGAGREAHYDLTPPQAVAMLNRLDIFATRDPRACREAAARLRDLLDRHAKATYQRQWRAKRGARTGTPGRRPEQPHGTRAGYRRHRRAGEDACDACREANTRAMNAYRQAKRKATT